LFGLSADPCTFSVSNSPLAVKSGAAPGSYVRLMVALTVHWSGFSSMLAVRA